MLFKDKLYNVIASTEESATSVRFQIRLNPESAIFKAHFPGEPIMPGACILQMVQELFMVWTQRDVEIAKVNNLKFLSVITPVEVLDLEVVLEIKKEEADVVQLKADVVKSDTDYTKMSLLLQDRK